MTLNIEDIIHSPEAVRIAIENGAPEKWEEFTLYLGNEKDFEEFGAIVLNVFTVSMGEEGIAVKGTVLDPQSAAIIKVY